MGPSTDFSETSGISCRRRYTVNVFCMYSLYSSIFLICASPLDFGLPTSVDFLPVGVNQIVVSYSSAKTIIYDTETGKSVVNLDSAVTYGESVQSFNSHGWVMGYLPPHPTPYTDGTNKTQINQVVSHPTLPLLVTAHEDKYIRFFDSKSGQYSTVCGRDLSFGLV